MQEFDKCHRVICARKCGGEVIFLHDLPTERVKICVSCGQRYFFPPTYDQDYHDHRLYQEEAYAEGAACKAGA